MDEVRIGQKKITRRAMRGTEPRAPWDQGTASTDIFGSISPGLGKVVSVALPLCNTDPMSLQLAEIAKTVAPGALGICLSIRPDGMSPISLLFSRHHHPVVTPKMLRIAPCLEGLAVCPLE